MHNLSMILAMDLNGGIGLDNKLPWHIPAELKYFKEVTTGKTVVMGRKTFESIGKPLPNRKNIVISSKYLPPEDNSYTVINSYSEWAKCIPELRKESEVIVIGGKTAYEYFAPCAEKVYLTQVQEVYPADTFINIADLLKFPNVEHLKPYDMDKLVPTWQIESAIKIDATETAPAFIKYVYTKINRGV